MSSMVSSMDRRPWQAVAGVAAVGVLLAAGLAGWGDDAVGGGDGPGLTVARATIETGGEIPAGATALALIMRDDTVRYTHWIVVDIPVTTTEVAAGTPPEGGTVVMGYDPVCPPAGATHTYVWTLYALDGPAPDPGGNPA